MSDSDESGVTYTEVSSPFEDLSDIGSPRADDYEYLELPEMPEDPYVEAALQAPPSPDYVPGPEEPEQAPPLPDYIPGPEHTDDEIATQEEDEPMRPEEDPVDYSADGGDDGDDEDEPSEEDEDDDVDMEARWDEDLRGEFYTTPVPTPLWSDAEVARLLAISTPPSSPLSPWSSPLPQIPSPSLPLSPPSPDRPEVTLPPRKRLGISLGPRYEVGESSYAATARPAGGLRADYSFVATMDREIRRDPEREVGYGITDSWDEIVETLQGAPTEARLSQEAWRRSMDASDLAYGEVMSLRTIVLGQMLEIRELHAADRRRRAMTSEMLKADHRRSEEMRELRTADRTRQQQLIQTLIMLQSLQGQVTILQGQVAALQGQKRYQNGATRSTPVTTTPAPTATTTTSVTNAQLQAMIDQGVSAALAARDANRNGDDSHTSGTGGRRTERITETVFPHNHDAAYAMTWADLRKKMTDKYCPRNKMKKLEAELMFPEESDKIEMYVGGLPDMIHGNIVASKRKTMQEAVEMATELMDKKVIIMAERQAENKKKFENTSRNNQNQQQQNKRQNTGRAYTTGTGERKPYRGSKPLCAKCNYHHDGPCAPKCHKCNKVGHFARDCRSTGNANNANNQRGTGSCQKPTCFECGVQGHYKRECPKLKNNKNRRNQVGNDRAPSKVYVVGRAGTNPDSNIVTGMFLLNNRYVSILFNTGADRSFVSTAYISQMISRHLLRTLLYVELADRE
ncbi:putative reverse transcriptase domain-containing protein [Tanacetum coccineum]